MGFALNGALRQIQGIRDSLAYVITCGTIAVRDDAAVESWISGQGLKPFVSPGKTISSLHESIDAHYRSLVGVDVVQEARKTLHSGDDFGPRRGNASWSDPDHFILTSAYARGVAVLEQFEKDVLKALFYYRPAGKLGPDSESMIVVVERAVILESPQDEKSGYQFPATWNGLRKKAEYWPERNDMLKKVFNVALDFPDWLRECKNKRNAIAHSFSETPCTLKDVVDILGNVALRCCELADKVKSIQLVEV